VVERTSHKKKRENKIRHVIKKEKKYHF
jgi:hypothetical protein